MQDQSVYQKLNTTNLLKTEANLLDILCWCDEARSAVRLRASPAAHDRSRRRREPDDGRPHSKAAQEPEDARRSGRQQKPTTPHQAPVSSPTCCCRSCWSHPLQTPSSLRGSSSSIGGLLNPCLRFEHRLRRRWPSEVVSASGGGKLPPPRKAATLNPAVG